MDIINVTKSSLPEFEEYCAEIKDIWESHWLTNMGNKHIALENQLKNVLCADNISLFTNGHLALEAVLKVLNLSGEVITSPYTFASTVHAIVRCGLKPVFCDINPDNFTIDVDKIEALINKNTCAILPIHVYGNVADYKRLDEISKTYDLKLIYDAAHGFGVFADGISTANMGDAAMFSFHAAKVFNTIEGGAVCFKDPKLQEKLYLEKNFGIVNEHSVVYCGGNAKMNEFQAAMGLCNLRHLSENIAKRKIVIDRYFQNLNSTQGIQLWKAQENVVHNYSYMPVLFDVEKRDLIYNLLKENGIKARKYFYPLCNDYDCYDTNSDSTPIAKLTALRILTLPLYPDLDLDIVDKICDIIKQALR